MTTLEIIKMLVEQAIKEDSGNCEDCKFDKLSVEEYPCCKCKRTHLDYYDNKIKVEVSNSETKL